MDLFTPAESPAPPTGAERDRITETILARLWWREIDEERARRYLRDIAGLDDDQAQWTLSHRPMQQCAADIRRSVNAARRPLDHYPGWTP